MYCASCGNPASDGSEFCGSCGTKLESGTKLENRVPPADRRPIAGIVVGAVFGVIGLIWSLVQLFNLLYSTPVGATVALYRAFPGLEATHFWGGGIGLLGNTVLLIGILLAFLRHPEGPRVTRITCYLTLAVLVILFGASYLIVTNAPVWQTLGASAKGGVIGGLVGGIIGGIIQWGIILFLFRKRRWP